MQHYFENVAKLSRLKCHCTLHFIKDSETKNINARKILYDEINCILLDVKPLRCWIIWIELRSFWYFELFDCWHLNRLWSNLMHLLYIKQYHVLCSIYVLNEQPWIKEEQVPTTKRVVPPKIFCGTLDQ